VSGISSAWRSACSRACRACPSR